MYLQSITCGLPCCVPDKEQTTCSRNLRITSIVLGIIVVLIGVGMLSSVSPLGAPIGWTCASLGILAIAMGSCLRCFKIKDISNIPMQETTSETAETSIHRKINFGETFTSGEIRYIDVSLNEMGRSWSLVESESNEICTIAAFPSSIRPAITTWVSKEGKMRMSQTLFYKRSPSNFKFYKDTLLVSFEDRGVYVTTVGYGSFPKVEDNPNYLQNHFKYRARQIDINENFLVISTNEGIFVASKEEQVKYKLNHADQLVLNGDYLIGFSKEDRTLKIWDLINKRRCLEINNADIGEIKKLGNGFVYTIKSEEDYSKDYYTWYPNDDFSSFIKTIDSLIFASSDRYIAIVTLANQIEIYDDNFNSIRTIQLEDDAHISNIQFLGTHIVCCQSRTGQTSGNGVILEEETSCILAFDPVFSKE